MSGVFNPTSAKVGDPVIYLPNGHGPGTLGRIHRIVDNNVAGTRRFVVEFVGTDGRTLRDGEVLSKDLRTVVIG